MKRKFFLIIALLLALCFTLAACSTPKNAVSSSASLPAHSSSSSTEASSQPHQPVTLLVAAAASLEHSFANELIPLFEAQYSWITVEGSYDSSGKLQTQIEEGLEADIFMSAALKQMAALTEAGLVDKTTVVELLENEIVLIAASDSPLIEKIKSFNDIALASSIALGDPDSVPAGQYAKEALVNLGLWEAAQAKASFGTNVTEVLNWVAEGSAEVGIVYATDAASNEKVQVLATAPEGSLDKKVIYPVGIIAATPHREAAELFVQFLQSPGAMSIFEKHGFLSNL